MAAATATKKAAAKRPAKAPAKKPAAKQTTTESTTTAADRKAARVELGEQIVEMRAEEPPRKWEDIAAELGTSTGRAMLLHMEATVKPKDKIKGATDEELGEKIAAARDEDRLSWGQIMARTGLAETRCRTLYENATGTSTRGNRIGKGGRYPDGTTPPARAAKPKEAAAKKAAAKKAPAKKAPAKGPASGNAAVKKISGMSEVGDIAAATVGKIISFKTGGKQSRVKVADLLDVVGEGDDMELTVSDAEEIEYTIPLASIIKIAAR